MSKHHDVTTYTNQRLALGCYGKSSRWCKEPRTVCETCLLHQSPPWRCSCTCHYDESSKCADVSINEVACYRTERTLLGCRGFRCVEFVALSSVSSSYTFKKNKKIYIPKWSRSRSSLSRTQTRTLLGRRRLLARCCTLRQGRPCRWSARTSAA